MKGKVLPSPTGENYIPGDEQVRAEIQIFLEAIHSYPERFARDPDVTFEQHCCSLIRASKT